MNSKRSRYNHIDFPYKPPMWDSFHLWCYIEITAYIVCTETVVSFLKICYACRGSSLFELFQGHSHIVCQQEKDPRESINCMPT